MGLMFLSGEGYPGCRSCCRYKYQVRKQISCWGCLQSRVQAGSDSVKVLWADPDFPMGTKLYLPGEIPGTAFSNGMMIIGALKLTRSIGLAAQNGAETLPCSQLWGQPRVTGLCQILWHSISRFCSPAWFCSPLWFCSPAWFCSQPWFCSPLWFCSLLL